MNKEAILHIPESKYCFPLSEKTVELRLRTARGDKFDAVNVIYGNKYEFYKQQSKSSLVKKFTDNAFDYYITRLTLEDVRLVYIFELKTKHATYYFSEDGLSSSYQFEYAYFNAFQLPYINAVDIHREVEWMRQAVFYQIFIDRFFRGDVQKDDSYINLKWGEIPSPNSFAGGDLKGISEKLNYLEELGINVLYLTPIFRSISNHKYDISDYYNIDRHFGSNDDFRELVKAAHKKGIRIVLDAVFNHCSEHLAQFQDVVEKGKTSPYFNWFLIKGDKPVKNPLNYECFSICDYMPKFNTSNKEVQDFLIDIAVHWIKEYGIDGWRLDVSDEVSHNFWRKFREKVKEVNNDCVIIGENWHDANPSLQGEQYDSIMNYAFTKACYDYFADDKVSAEGYARALCGLLMRNTVQVNAMMLNILDSHDTHRFLTQVKGNKDRLICALSVTFMYMGAPGIYYGTEIGLNGGYDPDCRRTFDWDKAYSDKTLANIIKALAALKNRRELREGDIKIYAHKGLFVLERRAENTSLKLYVNKCGKNIKLACQPLLSHNYDGNQLLTDGFLIKEENYEK